MKRIASLAPPLLLVLLHLSLPAAAQAGFGIEPGSFSVEPANADRTLDFQAGSHLYAYTVKWK